MIFFRADSNEQIASGHVMRCLSIAQEFKSRGMNAAFIAADENPAEMVESAGFPLIVLDSPWNDLSQEIPKVQDILRENKDSMLLIDTYQVNRSYVESMLHFAKVCYLGSKREALGALSALINYSTDIDYDFYSQAYHSDVTKLLLGPGYAPLRKEFQHVNHPLSEKMRRILITTGNTDAENIVGRILDGISGLSFFPEIVCDVVVGRMFTYADELTAKYRNSNIIMHRNVASMSELMIQSDLAISACGTTVYELVASRVPVVTFAMVAEQRRSAETLSRLGAVKYCGQSYRSPGESVEQIVNAVKAFYHHPKIRLEQAERAGRIIDGDGCRKIVNELAAFMD